MDLVWQFWKLSNNWLKTLELLENFSIKQSTFPTPLGWRAAEGKKNEGIINGRENKTFRCWNYDTKTIDIEAY